MPLRFLTIFLCATLVTPATFAAPPRVTDRAHTEAMALAREALHAFVRRDFANAARLYLKAATTEPDVAEFWFGAARAERESGRVENAREHFARVVTLTASTNPLHAKALAAGDALAPPPEVVVELPVALTPTVAPPQSVASPVIVPASPTPEALPVNADPVAPHVLRLPPRRADPVAARGEWRRPAGWTSTALGVAAASVAVGLAMSANNAQSSLDGNKMADGRYNLLQITQADAITQQSSINARWTWSGVVGSVAVAALLAGGWWLLSPTEPRGGSETAAAARAPRAEEAP